MANSDVWIPITQTPFFVEGSRLLTSHPFDRRRRADVGAVAGGPHGEDGRGRAARAGGGVAEAISERHLEEREPAEPARRLCAQPGRRVQQRIGAGTAGRDVPDPCVDGRAGAADSGGGVRQPGQPAAGARGGEGAGDVDSRGRRRGAGTADPAIVHRKPAAGAAGIGRGIGCGLWDAAEPAGVDLRAGLARIQRRTGASSFLQPASGVWRRSCSDWRRRFKRRGRSTARRRRGRC